MGRVSWPKSARTMRPSIRIATMWLLMHTSAYANLVGKVRIALSMWMTAHPIHARTEPTAPTLARTRSRAVAHTAGRV
jgi:hypothetical protein